jgi:predicted permease
MRNWIPQLGAWRRRARLEAELKEEMETHLLLKQEEYLRSGFNERDARFAAIRDMGNTTLMVEESRSVWVTRWIESFFQDVAYGLRGLRRNPAFSLTAILSLGLAIGFNTSYFTVFNAAVLRPWPIANPDRVYTAWSVDPQVSGARSFGGFGLVEARLLAQSARNISGLAMQRGEQIQLGEVAGDARPALFVSGNYFRLLGAPMAAGRGFMDGEDSIDDPQNVAVISHKLWSHRFAADSSVLGRTVKINGIPFTVVGVAAEEFTGTMAGAVDFYLPMASLLAISTNDPEWARGFLTRPGYCCAQLAVRLADGASPAQVESELDSIHRQFLRSHAKKESALRLERTAFATPGQRIKLTPLFSLFFLAVTFVLLLACANVANLTLARAAARQRELGIRLSIGASRMRIVRQLVTESLLLALAGGALGIGVANWLPRIIFDFGVQEPLAFHLRPDTTVLAYALVIACAAAILSGLAPALHATRADRTRLFHAAPAAVTSRFSLRGAMLTVQVTLSVVLLAGAFLMLRATDYARTMDLGFRIEGVSQAQVQFPVSAFSAEHVEQTVDSLGDVWSSRHLAVTSNPPMSYISNSWGVVPPGSPAGAAEESVPYVDVTPGYFDVLNIPILHGRNFNATDRGRNVLIVNQKLARAFWPSGGAVGRLLKIGGATFEVIGMARDAMTASPGELQPTIYRPFSGRTAFLLWKREENDASALQSQLQRLDPRIRLETTTLAESRDRRLRGSKTSFWLTGGLGTFALSLAAIGIFGAFSFAVEQRRQEIGIRLSLGARTAQVLRTVLSSSSKAVSLGLAIGLILALALSRLLADHLYGLSPLDPLSYFAVLVVVVVSAALASWSPALRATRIDPAASLRSE